MNAVEHTPDSVMGGAVRAGRGGAVVKVGR